jgi:hypothetical protein
MISMDYNGPVDTEIKSSAISLYPFCATFNTKLLEKWFGSEASGLQVKQSKDYLCGLINPNSLLRVLFQRRYKTDFQSFSHSINIDIIPLKYEYIKKEGGKTYCSLKLRNFLKAFLQIFIYSRFIYLINTLCVCLWGLYDSLGAGLETRPRVGQARNPASILGKGTRLLHSIQTQPPIQWELRMKHSRCETGHLSPSSAEVKTARSFTSSPPNVFMAWCSGTNLPLYRPIFI